MYEKFFQKLIDRKKDKINRLSRKLLFEVKFLQKRLQLIIAEIEKQKQRNPKTDTVKSNIKALDDMKKKLDKEILIRLSKIKVYDKDLLMDQQKLYQLLKKHPDIWKIEIHERSMRVKITTKDINSGKTNIGKYVIEINFEKEDIFITRFDKKKIKYNGEYYYHPFITNGGYVCFGNHNKKIEYALTQGGFYSIAIICISLLKDVDDDGTRYIPKTRFHKWARDKVV